MRSRRRSRRFTAYPELDRRSVGRSDGQLRLSWGEARSLLLRGALVVGLGIAAVTALSGNFMFPHDQSRVASAPVILQQSVAEAEARASQEPQPEVLDASLFSPDPTITGTLPPVGIRAPKTSRGDAAAGAGTTAISRSDKPAPAAAASGPIAPAPVDEASLNVAAVDVASADAAPADVAPADVSPADQAAANAPPAAEASADEAPADAASADEAPAQVATAEPASPETAMLNGHAFLETPLPADTALGQTAVLPQAPEPRPAVVKTASARGRAGKRPPGPPPSCGSKHAHWKVVSGASAWYCR